MMRHVLALTVAVALALAVEPGRAMGCSGGGGDDPARDIERADAVFLGKAVSASRKLRELKAEINAWPNEIVDFPLNYLWSGDVATTFEVETVFKGDVGARAVIYANTNEAACGYRYDLGTRYVVFADVPAKRLLDTPAVDVIDGPNFRVRGVFASTPMGGMTTGLGSGNLVYDDEGRARAAVLGLGRPPVSDAVATESGGRVATAAATLGWTDEAIATAAARGTASASMPLATATIDMAPTRLVPSATAASTATVTFRRVSRYETAPGYAQPDGSPSPEVSGNVWPSSRSRPNSGALILGAVLVGALWLLRRRR